MSAKVKPYHQKNMDDVYESWNLNIYRKLEEADHMIMRMSTEAGLCNIPKDYKDQYIKNKLIDMIAQIAENREKK